MGWFDNEDGAERPQASPTQAPPRPTPKAPTAASEMGSTLGRRIHVDGTIVCGEDLTILGRVDGTIRAKGTLVIAKEADVRAKIDGQRVLVHGKVDGNVRGAERVVLGQTARLIGNIEAPTLEIVEGAYFKGNIDMKLAKPAKQEAEKKASSSTASESAGKATPGEESAEHDEGDVADEGHAATAGPIAGPGSKDAEAATEQVAS